jgi:hypothetical protein
MKVEYGVIELLETVNLVGGLDVFGASGGAITDGCA